MNKFIFIFFYLVFFNTVTFAEKITDVKITGNQRISNETIIILGKIDFDSDYDNEKLNLIIKDLYNSGFFKDITLDFSKGNLEIKVAENPIIDDIEILGLKQDSLKELLLEKISLKSRMSFSENKLQKDKILINNILQSLGYYFSNIKISKIENKQLNSVLIKFDIDTGNKAKISNISFIGDKKLKDKKLLEIITSEEDKFWKFISKNKYLNKSAIELDKRLLENFYKDNGYYAVKITDSFVELNKNGDFNLIFNISAGKQYYFNKLELNLPPDYNANDFSKVQKLFSKLEGKLYSINNFNSILEEIDKIASSKLYEFIDAKVDEKIVGDNKLDFIFNIDNSTNYFVQRINIFGNFQTIEEVIRNRFIVDEGDPLNKLLLNKSIDNIKSLRIFKNVNTKIEDGDDPNLKIINIDVEEQPTGEISLAAGAGTSGTTIGGGLVEKNFLGKGINLNTNLEISDDSIKGKFIYSKPNFAYSDNTLSTSLEATTSDFLSDFGYKLSKTGLSIGTSFQQYENFYFSPEASISFENLDTNSNASTQLKKQQGSYEDFYINYGINYDLRNSKYNPSEGNSTQFYQNLPIVSGNNELVNTFIFTQYKKLLNNSNTIGKASLYFKTVNSIDGSDARISKRGQVPYARLRGFEKGKIGPIDNKDYIGGNYVSTLNLSTNLPGILRTVENVDFSYFVDIANVWGVDYDETIDDGSKIRSSTGLGMNLLTPIGPLSFSLAQPITKNSTDKTETFRFNLGTTF